METLDQGIATALVLLGIAAMLYGVSALWRSVSNAKAHQQELLLEQEAHERASERMRERAARDQGHDDLLLALIPAGTALLGHWLGRRSLEPPLDPCLAPCMGGIPKPPRPMPPPVDDDRQTVELDLRELLDAVMELGVEKWLADLRPNAHADDVAPEGNEPEPTPSVAQGMG